MPSPILVTDVTVEAINRALLDTSRSTQTTGSQEVGETIKLLPASIGTSYTIKGSETASVFLITTGSSSDFTINFDNQTNLLGRVFDFYKIDSGTKEVVLTPLSSPQQYINGIYTSSRVGLLGQHCKVVVTSQGLWIVSQYLQVVSGEPSLGMPYSRTPTSDAAIYTNNAPAANIWYAVDVSAYVPVGAKAVLLTIRGSSASGFIYAAPNNGTAAGLRFLVSSSATSTEFAHCLMVILGVGCTFYIATNATALDLNVYEPIGYWL